MRTSPPGPPGNMAPATSAVATMPRVETPVPALAVPPPGAGQDEAGDLKQLSLGLTALTAGDFDNARRLLTEVAHHAPPGYMQSYSDGGKLHLRLWNNDEFLAWQAWAQAQQADEDASWQRSIYPEAYYYLGYIDIEQRDYPTALLNLHTALTLEPNHPQVLGEIAVIYSKLGQFQDAVDLYERTLQKRPYLTDRQRARALRGKGIALIDLNRLDEATALLRESLKFEPNHPLAMSELSYIERLRRSGQPPDPSTGNIIIVPSQSGPSRP